MTRISLFLFIGLLVHTIPVSAQQNEQQLIRAAAQADSSFWNAYNRCDVGGMMQFVPSDIEFFHDKGGITKGDSAFEQSIRKGLCVDTAAFHSRREKVAGSEGIYPMHKNGQLYGVLFTGKHTFHLTEKGKKEYTSGIAQYADLWLLENGTWKLGRVFSYDHQPAPYINNRKAINLPASQLKNFAGQYKGAENQMTVVPTNNALELQLAKDNRMTVFPLTGRLFFAKERDLTFEFVRNSKGGSELIVRENGKEVERLNKVK